MTKEIVDNVSLYIWQNAMIAVAKRDLGRRKYHFPRIRLFLKLCQTIFCLLQLYSHSWNLCNVNMHWIYISKHWSCMPKKIYLSSYFAEMFWPRWAKLTGCQVANNGPLTTRAQWESGWPHILNNIISGCMYSYVKLNFKAGLFSSTFWFERIFISKIGLLVFGRCTF